jgi:hypothetical protein
MEQVPIRTIGNRNLRQLAAPCQIFLGRNTSMSFGFGKAFATETGDCRSGFDRVLQGVELDVGMDLEALYVAFETGHREGDSRLTRKLMSAYLEGRQWRWRWFIECAADFERQGVWPQSWTWRGIEPPLQWEHLGDDTKIEMLERHLSICAFEARNYRERYSNPHVLGAWRFTLCATPGCPVEAAIVERKRAAIERDNFSDGPPYFPDDRSSITILGFR